MFIPSLQFPLFDYDRLSASLHQCSLISFTPGTSQREFQGKLTSAGAEGALLHCNSCLFFHVWDPEGSICNLAPKCVTQDTENWTKLWVFGLLDFSYKYKVIWRFLNRKSHHFLARKFKYPKYLNFKRKYLIRAKSECKQICTNFYFFTFVILIFIAKFISKTCWDTQY